MIKPICAVLSLLPYIASCQQVSNNPMTTPALTSTQQQYGDIELSLTMLSRYQVQFGVTSKRTHKLTFPSSKLYDAVLFDGKRAIWREGANTMHMQVLTTKYLEPDQPWRIKLNVPAHLLQCKSTRRLMASLPGQNMSVQLTLPCQPLRGNGQEEAQPMIPKPRPTNNNHI